MTRVFGGNQAWREARSWTQVSLARLSDWRGIIQWHLHHLGIMDQFFVLKIVDPTTVPYLEVTDGN